MSKSSDSSSSTNTDTKDSEVLLSKKCYSDKKYHACGEGDQPACHYQSVGFREWDHETARAWHDPCSICFPDGDPAPDSGEEGDE